MCGLCLNCPAHKCDANAMEVSEIEFKYGCVCPVIADACCSGKERMPVGEGMVNDKIVSVLRDRLQDVRLRLNNKTYYSG